MAGSVNKVILIGNLGKDPEIRRTQDGRPIANLRIATSESWRDKTTGEKREKTEWHSVVIFNENLCKIAEAAWASCPRISAAGPAKLCSAYVPYVGRLCRFGKSRTRRHPCLGRWRGRG